MTGVDVTGAGLAVRVSYYATFTRAFPHIALREGVRVRQLRPADESLESVFAYLIGQ